MPNKKESFFADFLKGLEKDKIDSGKSVETIEQRRYFLIVTEGKNTEPLYFDHFRQLLPRHMMETIVITGQGRNTIEIVETAIAKRDERNKSASKPAFDEVWAVFDKDDFTDKDFDTAVAMAQNANIEPGYSNECFEFWYVLHFQYQNNALHRNRYTDILSDQLGWKYGKGRADAIAMVKLISEKGNVAQAIKYGYMLEREHNGKNPAKMNPYSRIYLLVEKLLAYVEQH